MMCGTEDSEIWFIYKREIFYTSKRASYNTENALFHPVIIQNTCSSFYFVLLLGNIQNMIQNSY